MIIRIINQKLTILYYAFNGQKNNLRKEVCRLSPQAITLLLKEWLRKKVFPSDGSGDGKDFIKNFPDEPGFIMLVPKGN